ncbi:hypothetical protein [uncultured Friedmanniella sp.]|uniref:hypothetical protein n=1 Tax=uncultured Friedmanniella sp. TaxID=335381 RepID=UPI0035C9D7E5
MNKLFITLFVLQDTLLDKAKARRESGQGTLEYVAMVAVACIIIAAVVAILKPAGATLGTLVSTAIQKVTSI